MIVPTCPMCGTNDQGALGVVNHPAGRYACAACWTVFNGGDEEWRIRASHRENRPRMYANIRAEWAKPEPKTEAVPA